MILRMMKRCGLLGAMGMVLLAAAGWGRWSWLPQQQADVDAIRSQARHLRFDLQQAQTDLDRGTSANRIDTPGLAWDALWQGLPSVEQRVPLQAAVLAAARDNGVLVNGVQYQGNRAPWSERDGFVLWRQRMVMPAQGTYPAVKAWISQLLKERSLSVDELSVQRNDAGSDQVQARVAISLWWRKPEKGQP